MVGARGFEPPAPCSQSRCATRLRHAPNAPSVLKDVQVIGDVFLLITSYRHLSVL